MKDLEKATLPQWLNAPIIPKYSLRALTSTRALNAPMYAKVFGKK
jgi:hypothetical protein